MAGTPRAADVSRRDLSNLIGKIYDCVLDPSRWDDALDDIRRFFNTANAQLGLLDLQRGQLMLHKAVGTDDYWAQRQTEYATEVNDFTTGQLDSGVSIDQPLITSRILSDEYMATSPYWQNCVRPQGLVDIAQVNIMRTPTRVSVFGMARTDEVGLFSDDDVELLRLLVPHVRRAVTISNVLDARTIEKERMATTLDTLNLGVILTNEDSQVVHANSAAKEMMGDNGHLRMSGGRLRAEGKAAAEINAAVRQAARNEADIGNGGVSVRLTADGEPPIIAHVLPLAARDSRSRLHPAAVFVTSSVDEARYAQTVAATYGLTPAESKVLAQILGGKNPVEAALALGVTRNTARSHLKNIFQKTGVSRQFELVRLAMQISLK
jgi:DNA-binding CsgD family transcriptional regulator